MLFEMSFSQENSILLIMDNSGSMSGSRISELKQSATQIINMVNACTDVGLIVYSDEAVKTDFTTDKNLLLSVIDNIEATGGTMLSKALDETYKMVLDYQAINPDVKITAILLSDGAGDEYLSEISQYQNRIKNFTINTIGFNVSNEGEEQLKDIAKLTNGEYYKTYSGTLMNTFTQNAIVALQTSVAKDAKISSVVDIPEYQSLSFSDAIKMYWNIKKLALFSNPTNPQNNICDEFCLNEYLNNQYQEYPTSMYFKGNKMFFYYNYDKKWHKTNFTINNDVLKFSIEDYTIELKPVSISKEEMIMCVKKLTDENDETVIECDCNENVPVDYYQVLLYYNNISEAGCN